MMFLEMKKNKMKKLPYIFFVLTVWLISTALESMPADEEKTSTNTKYASVEANYLIGLKSKNEGFKANCAYYLGEMKSKKAVVPLMDMFRNENNDGSKLVAAWSLLRIGDPRGVFLIKRSMDLRENDTINIMLQHFYKDYVLRSKGELN
jgi:hypothetical protein